jgi:hypothetical protein
LAGSYQSFRETMNHANNLQNIVSQNTSLITSKLTFHNFSNLLQINEKN